jgi:DNA sulfur modification protein DndC
MKYKIIQKRLEKLFCRFKNKPIVVAFSGGKDSTFLLHHTLTILNRIETNQLVIVYADTLVENPVIHNYIITFLGKLKNYCRETKIDAEILITKPELRNTYWVNLIGKGYPLPNYRFRWCQDKLKIKPIRKALMKFSDGIILVAVRNNESVNRKKSLERRLNNMELERNGLRVFAPIFDIEEYDIWDFLMQNNAPWGENYESLLNLYKDARGECPLIPEKGRFQNGCGMRFGCWVCTVVREDKTLKNQAIKDENLKKLYEFRKFLIEVCNDIINRYPFRRNGQPASNNKGVLSLETRKKLLQQLLLLEKSINYKLIQQEEIRIIKNIWKSDSIVLRNFLKK